MLLVRAVYVAASIGAASLYIMLICMSDTSYNFGAIIGEALVINSLVGITISVGLVKGFN